MQYTMVIKYENAGSYPHWRTPKTGNALHEF
jgi:hypothetical protein